MKKKRTGAGQILLLIIMVSIAVLCILPVLLVLIATFTEERALQLNGFSFFPEAWSLDSWRYLATMKNQLVQSYGVTIFITVAGTFSSLIVQSLMAYSLSRKGFIMKNPLSIMLLITMLFSGGQLAEYLVNSGIYQLKNNLFVLWKPVVTAMNVIMMRSYIEQNISDSLIESAQLSGAGHFCIYRKICLPLMLPTLASLGFMTAVGYWNEWQNAQLYITSRDKAPLQLILIRIQKNLDYLASGAADANAEAAILASVPELGVRMAILFTVLGPIMICYPYFQRYFVKGLTMGGVKG